MRCANCGNENVNSLFDEGDTFYCSVCCHRTRHSDGQDDLVVCPYCNHLRDRKAMYCMWCNTAWGTDLSYVDNDEDGDIKEFEDSLTSSNLRYGKLKGRRNL